MAKRKRNQQFEIDGVDVDVNDPATIFRGIMPMLGRGRSGYAALRRELGTGVDPFALPGMVGFGLRELTAAVSRIETVPLMLEALLGEQNQATTMRFVSVEEQNDFIAPAPTVPHNANPPVDDNPERKLFPFEIPRLALQKDVNVGDVEAIREFATQGDQQSLEDRLVQVITRMLNRLKVGEELMRRGSVDGVLRAVKPDGSVVDLHNFYTQRGTGPLTGELKLSAQKDVNTQFVGYKRKAELKVQGQSVTKWLALASSDVYDAITTHASVQDKFLNWQNAAMLLDDNRAGGFRFAGNIELHDVGNQILPNIQGGQPYKWWADGTLKIVPVGCTHSRNAPIDHKDAVGKPGLPAYITPEAKKFGKGWELLGEEYYAVWNSNLEAITDVSIT